MDTFIECSCKFLIFSLASLPIIVYVYIKWSFQYWKKKDVPHVKPTFPFGNYTLELWKQPINGTVYGHYKILKSLGVKYGGIYVGPKPIFVPIDLDIIRNIFSVDFTSFMDRGLHHNEKTDPLSAHLFALDGNKWKNLRGKLSPAFTSGKLKYMLQTLLDCGDPLLSYIEQLQSKEEPIDIKDVVRRFSINVIGSCAFGFECNSFQDPNNEFTKMGNEVFNPSPFYSALSIFNITFPKLAKKLGLPHLPKNISKFYSEVAKNIITHREGNNVTRNDFMQLLIGLKNNEVPGWGKLTVNEISAQAFVFMTAGFETASSAMSFAFLELARNQDVQEKAREEIKEVLNKYNGEITYDGLMDMKYTTQVIEESLRKYPPIVILRRQSTQEYKIPGTDITLDKGTVVMVSVYGIHHNQDIYPEPEVFDPERFSEENKKKRHPYSYLPFGEGPRFCIGMRFAMMEVKIGLALLLSRYKLKVNPKTQYPITFNLKSIALSSSSPIILDVERL